VPTADRPRGLAQTGFRGGTTSGRRPNWRRLREVSRCRIAPIRDRSPVRQNTAPAASRSCSSARRNAPRLAPKTTPSTRRQRTAIRARPRSFAGLFTLTGRCSNSPDREAYRVPRPNPNCPRLSPTPAIAAPKGRKSAPRFALAGLDPRLSGSAKAAVPSDFGTTSDTPWPDLFRPPTSLSAAPPAGSKAWMAGPSPATRNKIVFAPISRPSACSEELNRTAVGLIRPSTPSGAGDKGVDARIKSADAGNCSATCAQTGSRPSLCRAAASSSCGCLPRRLTASRQSKWSARRA
jgi:hypothetical protein